MCFLCRKKDISWFGWRILKREIVGNDLLTLEMKNDVFWSSWVNCYGQFIANKVLINQVWQVKHIYYMT